MAGECSTARIFGLFFGPGMGGKEKQAATFMVFGVTNIIQYWIYIYIFKAFTTFTTFTIFPTSTVIIGFHIYNIYFLETKNNLWIAKTPLPTVGRSHQKTGGPCPQDASLLVTTRMSWHFGSGIPKKTLHLPLLVGGGSIPMHVYTIFIWDGVGFWSSNVVFEATSSNEHGQLLVKDGLTKFLPFLKQAWFWLGSKTWGHVCREEQNRTYLSTTWRIIRVSKWLITMVIVSPLRIWLWDPLQFMAYINGL